MYGLAKSRRSQCAVQSERAANPSTKGLHDGKEESVDGAGRCPWRGKVQQEVQEEETRERTRRRRHWWRAANSEQQGSGATPCCGGLGEPSVGIVREPNGAEGHGYHRVQAARARRRREGRGQSCDRKRRKVGALRTRIMSSPSRLGLCLHSSRRYCSTSRP